MKLLNKLYQKNLLIIFLVAMFYSCSPGKAVIPEDMPLISYEVKDRLSAVLERAEIEDKIVFVDMYADWCLPCKVMDANVYSDQATAEFMNKNFINYKVNGEKGEGLDLNAIYNVKGYPTQLFLDSKGKIIEQNLGALGIVGFNVLAERALAKAKELK